MIIYMSSNTAILLTKYDSELTCSDPKYFVRGDPTLTLFLFVLLVDEGWEDPNTTIAGHH